jgi:hypothetical protein
MFLNKEHSNRLTSLNYPLKLFTNSNNCNNILNKEQYIKYKRRFILILKKITSLVFGILLISVFIVPTFVSASTTTTQNNSKNGSFLSFSLSDLLSIIRNDKSRENNQSYNNNNNNNYNNNNYGNNDDWWDCIQNWWCGGNNGGKDQCCDGWGNDKGCTSSADIWKWWYCH